MGRGVLRIIKSVREVGLKELEFVGGETELIVNIYRKTDTDQTTNQTNQTTDQTDQTTDQTNQTTNQTYILKDEESMVLKLISDNPEIT